MRESLRPTLLRQALALLCYLAGMVLFLVVAVGAYLAPPENSLANLTTVDILLVLVSVVLLGAGGLLGRNAGGIGVIAGGYPWSSPAQGPEQSTLAELGYRMPPEESDDEPGAAGDDADGGVRCPDCGTRNDPSFTYCKSCSSELPDR